MSDDATLLCRYASTRAEGAFAELVRRHIDGVYSAALRRVGGDVHLAEDVAQQVFVVLARNAAALIGHPALTVWLYVTTRNEAGNVVRRERRRKVREQEAHTMQQLLSEEESPADWSRVAPVLDAAIDALNDAERTTVLLRFVDRRAFAEIGAALKISEDAARMRVERALDKLRALLARRGVTSTSAALSVALASQTVVAAPAGLAATVIGGVFASAGGMGASGALTAAAIFMKTKTTLVIAIAVLAIGFSIYEFNALRRERGAAAELQAQLQAAQQQVAAVNRQSATLRSELEAARAAKSVLGIQPTLAGAPASASLPAPEVAAASAKRSGGGFTLGSMTREEARLRSGHSLDTNLAALYRELNLTPAQRERFKNLMLDIDEANHGLFGKAVAEARARNPKFDRADQFEVFEALQAQTQAEQQAAVRQVLGEPAAEALQAYQTTFPMRSVVKQLAANLLNSGAPLLPAQADRLIEIMARNARGPTGKVETVALNIETALAQAGGLLSPAQLAELRKAAEIAVTQAKKEREFNTAPAASLK